MPPVHKGRPLWHYLMGAIFVIIIVTVLAGIGINLINTSNNYYENARTLRDITEIHINSSFHMIDTGLKIYDKSYNRQMEDAFAVLMGEYNATGGDPSRLDLLGISERIDMEIYVINPSGVIEYSTSEHDIGLDFSEIYPDFYEYLKEIWNEPGFYPDRVVRDYVTGEKTKFAYMPTPDHRYILELGIRSEQFSQERNLLRYGDVAKEMQTFNPYLENIRVFQKQKKLIGDPKYIATQNESEILSTIYRERRSLEFIYPEQGKTIKYLFVDMRDPDYGADMSLAVELTYSDAKINASLQNVILIHLIVAIVALLAGGLFALTISRRLTRPINDIVNDVNMIAQGDLDHQISMTRGLEFGILEQSINTMIGKLKAVIEQFKESEVNLRRSEERYRTVVENQTELITRFSPDRVHLFANDAYCRYFGKDINDIIGKRFVPRIPLEDQPILKEYFASFSPANPVGTIEHRIIMPDNSIRWQQWNDRAIFDPNGTVVEYQSVGRDITERKEIENALKVSEEKYRELVENANSIILRLDPRGYIMFINEYAQKFFGYHDYEILGRNVVGTIVPETDSSGRNLKEKILDLARIPGKYENTENENMRKNGDRVWISWTNKPKFNSSGEVTEILCIGNDITWMKQAAEEISKLNEELERRVIARTSELEAVNRELESFSYTVSHDLRAPLRAIDGFSSILTREYLPLLPPGAREYLEKVRLNAQQMGRLIDDILAFSRTGRVVLNRQPVSPRSIALEAMERLQAEREDREVEIAIGELPGCNADPTMLRQVFHNLLSNALKFTRRQPVAKIEIGSFIDAGQTVYYVRDNGIGFDMQYASSLFGVFQRLHSEREFEGSGVGLAIVKRMIERHGGRIWAESEVGRGATFYFTIPDEFSL
jgi:PAS domain S-box-containing protein